MSEADAHRVWPPIVLGRRKFGYVDLYVHSGAPKITLPRLVYTANTDVTKLKEITINSIKIDQGPLYVFPPSVDGYTWAMYIDLFSGGLHSHTKPPITVSKWLPLSTDSWTLKYATVKDMSEIDPHRKLVDWNAMLFLSPRSAMSKNISNDTISMIGTPPCLSAAQSEEFQEKLRAIHDGQISLQNCVAESMRADSFASKLQAILDQPEANNREIIQDIAIRGLVMRETFAFDGARVATASFERLSSLGVGKMREHGGNMFTPKMINRGTELELKALQSTAEEIRRATTNKRKLKQLRLNHLESTRNLVEKQRKEMIQHLLECATKSQIIMEEEMLSRVKLMISLQQAEQKVSGLQKFISAGATVIAEEVYKDALKERDEEHASSFQKLAQIAEEVYKDALKERDEEHASSLTKLREAVKNQECCICYNELEGFSLLSSQGESSLSRKLQKRACFLPCMHANVCTTCSEERWNEGPKECPICRQELTEKPRVIYL